MHARPGGLKLLAALPLLAVSSAGAVEGRVVQDDSGAPVRSAEVRIFRPGAAQLTAELETDRQGRFRAAIGAGDYVVEVSKPGFAMTALRVRLDSEALLVRLVKCGSISGRVTDSGMRPVARARIWLMTPAADGTFQPAGSPDSVDETGRYRIHDLRPGRYAIAVSYEGTETGESAFFYPSNSRPQIFPIGGGEEYLNIDFVIGASRLYRVAGRIERERGGWYAVTLAAVGQPSLPVAREQSRPDGTFRFGGVPAGSYHLFVSGPTRGYTSNSSVLGEEPLFARTRIEVAGDIDDVALRLQRGTSVSLLLNTPAAGGCSRTARAILRPHEAWGVRLERQVELSAGKEQTVADLAPTRYGIEVSGTGGSCFGLPAAPLDFSGPKQPSAIALSMAPAGSIRGRLTGAPRPTDFQVVLLSARSQNMWAPVEVSLPEPNGQFSFSGLHPGSYRIAAVRAREPAGARLVSDPNKMSEIDVPGGAPTEIDLPAPANPE